MEKNITGAWLVHHTNKLQKVDNQSSFENIYTAGKAGILLSSIAATRQSSLPTEKVTTLAKASNINKLELPSLLEVLKEHHLIDIGNSGVDVIGVTSTATLQHTANIYEDLNPTQFENASIDLSELSSEQPQNKKEIASFLSDTFKLSSSSMNSLLADSETIGFVDVEKIGGDENLYFNGNLFRRDAVRKVDRVLATLSSSEHVKMVEFNEHLMKSACISVEKAKNILGVKLFNKLSSIGLYDINIVSNQKEEMGYVTRPSAFSKYSNSMVEDAFDLAKAFVSSLTYGITRSSYARGQIIMIEKLLKALIDGRWVGPVHAIGEDYKILELKHVVEVNWGSNKGRTGYNMRLLKKEVGELALQVIMQGDASQESLTNFPTATINKYIHPEENRSRRRRKQLRASPKSTNDMLMVLRTGGGL